MTYIVKSTAILNEYKNAIEKREAASNGVRFRRSTAQAKIIYIHNILLLFINRHNQLIYKCTNVSL